ncbi:RDD family protein [Thermodesulfobacteriota bacterium]
METDKEILTIQTPEHVGFQYVLAGLGSRAMAFILDTLIRGLLILFILVVVVTTSELLPQLDPTGLLNAIPKNWILALGFLAYGVIDLGYFLLFEALWGGQTPGKRQQKLRVIRIDGQPIGWLESALRNILRAVDMLAGFYPIGLLVMFLSSRSQRIGDYAAGTVVIREGQRNVPKGRAQYQTAEEKTGLDLEQYVTRLEPKQYQILRTFLQRRDNMDPENRKELARVLCDRLFEKWGISSRQKFSRETFIEEVVGVYEQRKRAV